MADQERDTPVSEGDEVVVKYIATGTYKAKVGELGFENCRTVGDVLDEEIGNFNGDWQSVLAFLPDLSLSVQLEAVQRQDAPPSVPYPGEDL